MKRVVTIIVSATIGLSVFAGCNDGAGKTTLIPMSINPDNVMSVILNKNSTSMLQGGTEQLIATIVPASAENQNVTWGSSNEAIATVSATGLVTAVAAGTANITVTTEDGGIIATCAVTVSTYPIAVTGIVLSKTDTTLLVGSSEQIFATISPSNATNQTVSWESDDTGVASVDENGMITAEGEGSAIVTATSEDGSYTTSCNVTVSPVPIDVISVSLNKSETSLLTGQTEQLSATIDPVDATDQYVSWMSTDNSIATVSSTGLVTVLASGTVSILVITRDGLHTDSCTVIIPSETEPRGKVTYSADSVSFTMVNVPAKSFKTNTDDFGYDTVANPYQISQTEVTYEVWYKVYTWASSHSYSFANAGKEGQDGGSGAAPTAAQYEPVTTVNWRDGIVWMNALTEWYNANNGSAPDLDCVYYSDQNFATPIRTSSTSTYTASIDNTPGSFDNPYVKASATGFRLLTSSEWELAARYIGDANNDGDIADSGEYYPGNYASGAEADYTNVAETNAVAWTYNPYADTHNVASKRPNTLGLYDMSGNIFEWCYSWYSDGVKRVSRGGSWVNVPDWAQVGAVNCNEPYTVHPGIGLRIGRTVTPLSSGKQVIFRRGTIKYSMTFVKGGYQFKTGVDDSGTATVPSGYWIGESEITYELWNSVYVWATDAARGANQYYFANAGTMGDGAGDTNQHPVTGINWRDAMVWCNAYTEWYNSINGPQYTCTYFSDSICTTPIRDSRDGSYGSSVNSTLGSFDNPYIKNDSTGFRLLTNNEWELAARYKGCDSSNGAYEYPAGSGNWWTPGAYASGAIADYNDSIANNVVSYYDTNSSSTAHIIMDRLPNALGLYDMSGNVFEWCFEYYTPFGGRIARGGCWIYPAGNLVVGQAGVRDWPFIKRNFTGFRIGKNQ